jgi:quercetin dioxygenase-like cupin family protein
VSQQSDQSPQPDAQEGFSCEWKPGEDRGQNQCPGSNSHAAPADNKSIFYPFSEYTWEGVKTEAYKLEPGNFANIVRNAIVGARGESCHFDLRYFEISEGGFSSLEKHQHEHVVICIRGQGKVRMGKKVRDVNFLDVVYISSQTPHQFINKGKEPFGFFCIVDRERDRPQELDLGSIP